MPLSVNSHAELIQEPLQNNMTGKLMGNVIENWYLPYHTVKQNELGLEIPVQCPRGVNVSSGSAYNGN